ncbi:MAG: recombination mediator RecR [Firmicutes bacterium]|nr:recombination mediator RecR [Bacillota bacterium]
MQLEIISKLINRFQKLPGVGYKTAQRYAYAIVDMDESSVEDFCNTLLTAKATVQYCDCCGNFSDKSTCSICIKRNSTTIVVVAYPKDVLALEKVGTGHLYHVLHGTLSPLEGRGVNDIRIKELLARVDKAEEVIIATNPDVEGEATAMYIAKLLKPFNVKVTRLAQGISMGSDIEYADEITLARAIEGRIEI